jgi:hypothetical protein
MYRVFIVVLGDSYWYVSDNDSDINVTEVRTTITTTKGIS